MRVKLIEFALLFCFGLAPVSAKVQIGGESMVNDNAHYLSYIRYLTVPFNRQGGATWNAGNDTTGKTAPQIQAIVDAIVALETDPVRKEIYVKMDSTPTEVFSFTGIPHAQGVVKQRLNTIRMMKDFNFDGIYSYASPDNPVSTRASNWEPVPSGYKSFRQISGDAYTAIHQICTSHIGPTSYGECLGGIKACIWWGAAEAMGKDAFNKLYPGPFALNMDSNASDKNTVDAIDTDILVPGDWVYFKNKNYGTLIDSSDDSPFRYFYKRGWLIEDAFYNWQGENALYIGVDESGVGQFEGLGVQASSADDMRTTLMTNYNEHLALAIKHLAKVGGVYHGEPVVNITPQTKVVDIPIINIERLFYQP